MGDDPSARVTWQLEARARLLLPSHMIDGLVAYIESGRRPGDFLLHVLANDFVGAAVRADFTNKQFFSNYALVLSGFMPVGSWGSMPVVESWMESGGLAGIRASTAKADPLDQPFTEEKSHA